MAARTVAQVSDLRCQVKVETLLPPALTLSLSRRERGGIWKGDTRPRALSLSHETAFFVLDSKVFAKHPRGARLWNESQETFDSTDN